MAGQFVVAKPVPDRRKKNRTFLVADANGNSYPAIADGVKLAVLMDIRDELQKLNALLHCPNFTGIPQTLKGIRRKLPTPDRAKKGQS